MRAPVDPLRDPQAFARTVLRVPRANVCEAEEALAEVRAPDEAWEQLCMNGFVSASFFDSAARVFERAAGTRAYAAHPPTVRACVAFACDSSGIRTAETLAAEVCGRLAPWGVAPLRTVRWRVVDASWQARPTAGATPYGSACDAVEYALLDRALEVPMGPLARALLSSSNPSAKEARYDAERAHRWAQAARVDDAIARHADPFAPALSIWGLGYALESVDDEGVTLVMQLV